jgi:hypothetical protein
MIAQRGGYCKGCRSAYEAGTPIFWHPDEGNYHWECWWAIEQPPHVIKLAQKLGYTQPVDTFSESEKDWSF